jgi:hypothetical protein
LFKVRFVFGVVKRGTHFEEFGGIRMNVAGGLVAVVPVVESVNAFFASEDAGKGNSPDYGESGWNVGCVWQGELGEVDGDRLDYDF